MYILGIESSCDETAASIIKVRRQPGGKLGKLEVLSNIISSQIEIHKKYGGVVPEVAAREHVLNVLPVINEALGKAGIKPSQLSAIGITKGPGLITSLITGLETARSLAYAWKKPLVEVNHIAGHIYANFIGRKEPILFPAVILTVSGGHTTLLLMDKSQKIRILGETRDDAAGEAYDKAAKMMDLGYPGGPIVAEYANKYQKNPGDKKIILPRPMLNSLDLDFSFSGLKTALLYMLKQDKGWKKRIPQYCHEYQQAILDILIAKTVKAARKYGAKTVMVTGGVSANNELRRQMEQDVMKNLPGVFLLIPERQYTTDNAAMVAAAAVYLFDKGKTTDFRKLQVDSGLQLR